MTSRLWRLLPALLLLCTQLSPARADEPVPDAATLRAKVIAASGERAYALREVIASSSSDGTRATRLLYRRGLDWREVVNDGPFHTERGALNNEGWRENENGQVVFTQPDSPPDADDALVNGRTARVHTPFEAIVVSGLENGHGIRDFVDPATWRLVRREEFGDAGTTVTTFDDFREDHGRTFAHHRVVDDTQARTKTDHRIALYDTASVQDRDVAIPRPRRALIEFPAGVRRAQLPATFGAYHQVYVRVMVGDRGLDFALDTGSPGISLDMSVAKELGIEPYGLHSTITAQRHDTARGIVREMHVGTLAMHDVMVELVPQGWEEQSGVKVVGLLGFDFLAELGVTIDYEHRQLVAVAGEEYRPPTDPMTIPVDVRVGSGEPEATVWMNGIAAKRFVIDTGGAGTFMILNHFAAQHPEAVRDEGAGQRQRPIRFVGIGGAFDVRAYQIKNLKLANVNFNEFVGYRVTSNGSYDDGTDGTIGADFLALFTVGIDYGSSRIYLVPNAVARKAMAIK